MVALNRDYAAAKTDTDPQNRVGGFFSLAAESVGEGGRSSRNRIGEKRGYAYETASVDTEYEYSPFGEVIRSSGSYADANPFRFSTKYLDVETGFYYYGYRHYDPSTGRWLSKDPIKERGGLNLYGMVGNESINDIDVLGKTPLNVISAGIGAIAGGVSGAVSGALGGARSGNGVVGAITGGVSGLITGGITGGVVGASGNPISGAIAGGAIGGGIGSASGQFFGNLADGQSIGEAAGNIDLGSVAGATVGGGAAGALAGGFTLTSPGLAPAVASALAEGQIVFMGETLGDVLLTPEDNDDTCN